MAANKNRCWPGYEPVQGKKPHSEGSCRPKAEAKLTDSESKFRQQRKKQLDSWQAEHPGTKKSAAQHLRAPASQTKKDSQSSAKKKSSTKKKSTTKKKKTAAAKKKRSTSKKASTKRTASKRSPAKRA